MSTLLTDDPQQPIYLVNFENYLKPKQPHKSTLLQRFEKPQQQPSKISQISKTLKRLKLVRWLRQGRSRLGQGIGALKRRFHQLPLPSFLSFLLARNDDGLCKRKTGFEIYCEMSSIHGFHIFVGAKTWQRVLWWLLIMSAVLFSLLVLIMSQALNEETPTIRFIESMTQPTASMPFPAITICSLNRASKQSLKEKSRDWGVQTETLRQLPWLASHRLGTINYTELQLLTARNASWSQLLLQLATPICEEQLLSCQWQGKSFNCSQLWQPLWTSSHGLCCSFNYQSLRRTAHCGSEKGLTVRLDTQREDYGSAAAASAGFEILLHDSETMPDEGSQLALAPSGTETHLMVKPFGTNITSYVGDLAIGKRRCYLPAERTLFHFATYTQGNCLAECRSERLYKRCGCAIPHAPRRRLWPECELPQIECVRNISWPLTGAGKGTESKQEQFPCNCWPLCAFNRYEIQSEVIQMDVSDEEFIGNFNASQEVLLHVYFDALSAEQLRLDVYENWLTFIGTFGGITGLFMGCSFVSVFELIFFVCVRPTCNWLTKQQIRYRLRQKRRRQAKAAAAAATLAGH